ncbi:unnamed protein product [Polarella glacialis]|uniref:Uncharacterized protein n=1 Tax=Polarella glacialis TaxID=89957 RepID=A0A813GIC3_POLGL|nr:unnamed protein product [Polarella glacialis]CAE8662587.1 unnamed protein product [Polarella glacialis]
MEPADEPETSGPALHEELAWEPDPWACPKCTLRNDHEMLKCAACEGLRPAKPVVGGRAGGNSSGVVVVLPRDPEPPGPGASAIRQSAAVVGATGQKRNQEAPPEPWACSACTLLNEPSAERCAACESMRWVINKRPMTAAALRAARKGAERNPAAEPVTGTVEDQYGIWGGLGPDREFLNIPTPREGRVVYRSAADGEVDIFAELAAASTASEPEQQGAVEEAAGSHTPAAEPAPEPAAAGEATEGSVMSARPAWRTEGAPLFAPPSDATLELLSMGVDEAALFEDAVGRLALLGFDPTKCHLALESAGGDESLAREFLIRET